MLRQKGLSVAVFALAVLFHFSGGLQAGTLPVSGASYHFDATEIDPGDLTEVRIDGSDTYVHTWEDQTSNGNDASMATESLQPLYIPDGSKYGDLPVVRFDSDRMIAGHAFADLDIAVGCTLFVVARQPGVASAGVSHSLDGGTVGVNDRRFSTQGEPATPDVRFNYRANDRNRQLRHNVSQAVGLSWNERTIRFDGAGGPGNLDKVDFYYNNSNTPEPVAESGSGTLGSTVGPVANVILGALQSDGTASWVGEIAEIVMFPTALNSTDLAAMHSYLRNKWFLPVQTLPVAGASYHFDATQIDPADTSQVRIDGSDVYVRIWEDRSTNLNDAVMTTDALQPLYMPDASLYADRPVVRFDGDRLISGHTFADLDAAVGCTLFVVANQHVANGGTSHAVDDGFNVNDRRFCTQGDPSGIDVRFNYRANNTGREFRHVVPASVGLAWHERTLRFDGAGGPSNLDKVDVYHNNSNTPDSVVEGGSGVLNPTVGAVANVIIGALESDGLAPWDGDIAEIVMFPSALNGTDLAAMHAYLESKWFQPMPTPSSGTVILIE